MSETPKNAYFKLVFPKEALSFMNRIQLLQSDVLQFLQSNLPHAENRLKNGILYATGDEQFSFRLLDRKGTFVKLYPTGHSSPYFDLSGCKGFTFQAVMYNNRRKIGKYVVFYEPYSLNCSIIARKLVLCRTMAKRFHFGDKPVVKYVFNFKNERVKRYFYVERRGIRAYGERHLSSMPDEDP